MFIFLFFELLKIILLIILFLSYSTVSLSCGWLLAWTTTAQSEFFFLANFIKFLKSNSIKISEYKTINSFLRYFFASINDPAVPNKCLSDKTLQFFIFIFFKKFVIFLFKWLVKNRKSFIPFFFSWLTWYWRLGFCLNLIRAFGSRFVNFF